MRIYKSKLTLKTWRHILTRSQIDITSHPFDLPSSVFNMFTSLTLLGTLVFLLGHGHAAFQMRWCTTSDAEQKKCDDFKAELQKIANDSTPACVQAPNAIECMKKIQSGDADLITLDGGEIYTAGKKYGMVPVVAEEYGYGTFYYAVAVVKKSNSDITISKLKGKKTCHTGAGKTSGWVVPIGTLLSKGYMKQDSSCNPYISAGNYFEKSCIPNVQLPSIDTTGKNPDNLCALCPDECKKAGNYSGYSGAFKCMNDGVGVVAFIKHTTVSENVNASEISNYQYLCKDGTRGEIGQHLNCNLAKVPSHAVMTSSGNNNKAKYVQVLLKASDMYKNDSGGGSFALFDSSKYGGKDLLFKDSTVKLVDESGKTYKTWLGDDYMNDLEALDDCVKPTVNPTAGSKDNKPYFLASVVFSLVALVLS